MGLVTREDTPPVPYFYTFWLYLAFEPLMQTLKSMDEEAQGEAIEGLGKRRQAGAIDALVPSLTDSTLYTSRRIFVDSDPTTGAPKVSRELVADHQSNYHRGLATISDERAIETLMNLLRNSPDSEAQHAARSALEKIRGHGAR